MQVNIGQIAMVLLQFLSDVADRGDPCPTDICIAESIKGFTRDKVQWHMRQLKLIRAISISTKGGSRKITIEETGKSTGWTGGKTYEGATSTPLAVGSAEDRRAKILSIIRDAAVSNSVVPSNNEISTLVLCSDETVSRDINLLSRRGVFKVVHFGHSKRKVVFPDGKETATLHEVKKRMVVRSRQKRVIANVVQEEEENEQSCYVSFAPCARIGCSDVVSVGKAYCDAHENADVLEWPAALMDQGEIAA